MPNQLLNMAAATRSPSVPTHQERTMSDEKAQPRQCLYSADGSQIFDGAKAIEAALDGGWVEHPDLVEKPAKSAKKKGGK